MAIVVKWTPQAEKGLGNVLHYLEENWTTKEILQLRNNIFQIINLITTKPGIFPISKRYKNLRKALVDKNNYFVYRYNKKTQTIEIINFRGTKQQPKH